MNVPDKLRSILPLNKTVTWLNQLRDCVISNTIVTDGLSLRKKVTPAGTILQAIGRGGGAMGGGSSSYDGMFATSDTSTESARRTTTKAGVVIVAGEEFELEETEILVTGSCYIFIKITYDNGYLVTVENSTEDTRPLSEPGIHRRPLAHVIMVDNKVDTVEQLWLNNIIYYEG